MNHPISAAREYRLYSDMNGCIVGRTVAADAALDASNQAACMGDSFEFADAYFIRTEFGCAGEILFAFIMSLRELCQKRQLS